VVLLWLTSFPIEFTYRTSDAGIDGAAMLLPQYVFIIEYTN
jgi:hypothetical protein